MKRDVLYLDDYEFPVVGEKSTLHALISNATEFKLFWMATVACDLGDSKRNSEIFGAPPKLYSESIQLPIRDWRDLVGNQIVSAADDDDPHALYVGVHHDLERSNLHFVSRQGFAIEVDWAFTWNGMNGRVKTDLRFTHVAVWLREVTNQKQAIDRLQLDLDSALFDEPEMKTHTSTGPSFTFKPKDC